MKINAHGQEFKSHYTAQPSPKRARSSRMFAIPLILALASAALVGAASAQTSPVEPVCAEKGKNVQCTEFGSISMDAQHDIRGEPITVTADINLDTGYAHQGARWVMFSIRNVTDDGNSPVTIDVKGFSTPNGDIIVTRTDQVKASEVNLWVDVLDLPIGKPISLELRVGATERGAFALETLVLAFDRGYAPISDQDGNDASLFSFTLLGVNKETKSTAGDDVDSLADGRKLPSIGIVTSLVVLTFALAVMLRRQRR